MKKQMMDSIDWQTFMKDFANASYSEKVQKIRSHIKWFETRCEWIDAKVWHEAVRGL